MKGFSITKTTKDPLPLTGKGLQSIKESILGKHYELSLVFIGSKLARKLNKERRKKDYPANVLSFPLAKDSGEIFICLPVANKESRALKTTIEKRIMHLLIHGCLHLKGHKHSATMDKQEERLRKKFGV